MQKWSDEDGTEFHNSDICYGREYKPDSKTIDVAKISIRGEFPDGGRYGYVGTHEMAVVIHGEGYIDTKQDGQRHQLKEGDVVYVEPTERFRWGGNMDLIVPCGPAFDPAKHKIEETA